MSTSITLKGLTAITAAAAIAVGGAGVAAAQNVIPGDDGDGRTVVVNSAGMDVEIVSVDRASGVVQVSFANNTGMALRCEAPNQDTALRYGGSVSTADVVEDSISYYSQYQHKRAEEVRIRQTISGSTAGVDLDLWPLLQLLPTGSAAELMSDAVALRAQIVQGNTRALVQGLSGTTPAFNLANGANTTRTIQLSPPSTSPRGEDLIGFFTICGGPATTSAQVQGAAQLYAWSAYEEGWPPPVPEPEEAAGSLGSGSLGSLGSNGDGQPPVNGDPDNEDPDNGEPGEGGPGDDEPGVDE